MALDPQRQNFWTTVPGILTGIAAVVTALTGLIVGLSQTGWIGSRGAPPQDAPAAVRDGSTTDAAPATASSDDRNQAPGAAQAPGASQEATVVITAQDGSVTTVYASSLQHRQTGRELQLLGGQTIPFDRIRTIDVTRHESDRARVNVTLVNGTVHDGAISEGLYPFAFTGTNDLGAFEIRVERLARLTFER